MNEEWWSGGVFFKGEPAAGAVETLIAAATKSRNPLLLSALNGAAVPYTMERAGGRTVVETLAGEIATLPIGVVGDDLGLSRQAAQLEAAHKLSLAGAFAAATLEASKFDIGDHVHLLNWLLRRRGRGGGESEVEGWFTMLPVVAGNSDGREEDSETISSLVGIHENP